MTRRGALWFLSLVVAIDVLAASCGDGGTEVSSGSRSDDGDGEVGSEPREDATVHITITIDDQVVVDQDIDVEDERVPTI